ncbi:hypothetical protein TRICI_002834 [Trichomonascus ciferrii]|uniref:Uncharacterized protein n=1 Tax=Trichomonascus ciferrii TaxID=44093 RepID=A0A642V5N1_9ASCO|nr:hypothetical protein TRICI_002834 [Trichomonascus ciferrii]
MSDRYAEAAKSGAAAPNDEDTAPIKNNHVSEEKAEEAAKAVEEFKDESRNFIQKIFARIGNGLASAKRELKDPKIATHVVFNLAAAGGVVAVLAQYNKKGQLPLWPNAVGYGVGAAIVGALEFSTIRKLIKRNDNKD